MTGLSQAGAQAELNALVAGSPYLALLTADPTGLETIAALTECADSGYSRQAATFTSASAAYPSFISNSGLISFGPFTSGMALPSQWLALVSSASGTSGNLLNTWTLSAPEQVGATEFVNIPPGALQSSAS
jgi:hypothetical protein